MPLLHHYSRSPSQETWKIPHSFFIFLSCGRQQVRAGVERTPSFSVTTCPPPLVQLHRPFAHVPSCPPQKLPSLPSLSLFPPRPILPPLPLTRYASFLNPFSPPFHLAARFFSLSIVTRNHPFHSLQTKFTHIHSLKAKTSPQQQHGEALFFCGSCRGDQYECCPGTPKRTRPALRQLRPQRPYPLPQREGRDRRRPV